MLNNRSTNKHLSDSEITRFQRRELDPDELISAGDHLAACAECVQRLGTPDLVDAAYALARKSLEVASEDHLLYEQLEGYCDERLSAPDREAVERHLAACDECEADLQSFFKLSTLIESKDRKPQPSIPPAQVSPTLSARLLAALRIPSYRSLLPELSYRTLVQAASLVLFAGLIIWGVTRSTQKRLDRLSSEVEQLRAEYDSMRDAASNAAVEVARLSRENEKVRQAEDPNPAAVRLNDGIGVVAIDLTGTVQGLEGLPGDVRTAVRNALTTAKLVSAAAPSVQIGRVGTLLGEAEKQETFKLITPVSSIVLSSNPTFRWEALPGATGYTVLLRDVSNGREIESDPLSDTQWTPKETLARGHTYAWMVEAVKDGRRLRAPALDHPYAGFKVLDKQSFDTIQHAEASWGNSHLVMGILYARAGLKDAARKELKELQAANPDAQVLKKLIKSLDSKR